jgi:hypothetical protein
MSITATRTNILPSITTIQSTKISRIT